MWISIFEFLIATFGMVFDTVVFWCLIVIPTHKDHLLILGSLNIALLVFGAVLLGFRVDSENKSKALHFTLYFVETVVTVLEFGCINDVCVAQWLDYLPLPVAVVLFVFRFTEVLSSIKTQATQMKMDFDTKSDELEETSNILKEEIKLKIKLEADVSEMQGQITDLKESLNSKAKSLDEETKLRIQFEEYISKMQGTISSLESLCNSKAKSLEEEIKLKIKLEKKISDMQGTIASLERSRDELCCLIENLPFIVCGNVEKAKVVRDNTIDKAQPNQGVRDQEHDRRGGRTSRRDCFTCGKPGHFARECPSVEVSRSDKDGRSGRYKRPASGRIRS